MEESSEPNNLFNSISVAFFLISGPVALLFWAAGSSTETIFLAWIIVGVIATIGLLSSK